MRILVAGTFNAGSQLAFAINTIKMADGFSKQGHKVLIVCHSSKTSNFKVEDLRIQYGISSELKWFFLPQFLLGKRVSNHWGFALLALPVVIYFHPRLIYSRTAILAWITSRVGIRTVVEAHSDPNNKQGYFRRLIEATYHRGYVKWITISNYLKDGYMEKGAKVNSIVVIPDAVDLAMFCRPNIIPDSIFTTDNNIVYAGHLYDYKGIPTIILAAELLPHYNFYFVGGLKRDVDRHVRFIKDRGIENCAFLGMKPLSEVPKYLWSANILLLPPSLNHQSAYYTSPIKLAEYLASGTPVISSNIPALRDWLSEEQTLFFEADNPRSLANSISELTTNKTLASKLSRNGKKLANKLSYIKRSRSILDLVEKL
ncbi:MAG: glycosyltransferase family 4 protein [Cyclobacteriaceae bacterium]